MSVEGQADLLSDDELKRLEGIERIHLVFKTHLDIGFTDSAAGVVERYVGQHIPRALDLARRSRDGGGPRFTWTLGSWLVNECLERGSPELRARLEDAIAARDIEWLANPFSAHSEFMGRDLFVAGLSLARRLDARFGTHTVAANLTDVPGHTIGIVPLLAAADVSFLHVGVNPGSAVPQVPAAFRWRVRGGDAEVVVAYTPSYGGITRIGDSPDALRIVFSGDNEGPPTSADVRRAHAVLEQQVPSARVETMGLNGFAVTIGEQRGALPVVEQEIGDSWIHGTATDPAKVAAYRELVRLRREWLASGEATEEEVEAASLRLMLVAEHTWGRDVKKHLDDASPYAKPALQAALHGGGFAVLAESWAEQRRYVEEAVAALPERLIRVARRRLAGLEPRPIDQDGLRPVGPGVAAATSLGVAAARSPGGVSSGMQVESETLELALDPATGAISHLVDKRTGEGYADAKHLLAAFAYQTFDARDYERYAGEYLRTADWWAQWDFGKPGLSALPGVVSATWRPELVAAHARRVPGGTLVRGELAFPSVCSEQWGAPRSLVSELLLADDAPRIDLTLSWRGKDAVRIPEALWVTFQLPGARAAGWSLDKLGVAVRPVDVVPRGARLHAVERGASYSDERRGLTLELLDTPVVSAYGPRLLDFEQRLPADEDGLAVCLLNNVWGTNFTMWYGEDGQARFVLRIGEGRGRGAR